MLASSMVDFQVAYDVAAVADTSDGNSFESLQKCFHPRPFDEGISQVPM